MRTVALLVLLSGCAGTSARSSGGSGSTAGDEVTRRLPQEEPATIEDQFKSTVDTVIAEYLRHNPIDATFAGIHEHDDELPDMSEEGRGAYGRWLRETLAGLERDYGAPDALPRRTDPARAGSDFPRMDYEVLRLSLEARLIETVAERRYRIDPDTYHVLASMGVYPLIVRGFAPAPERLRSAIARMESIPGVLLAGRRNLDNPSELATHVAMEQADGSTKFFRDTFPRFVESSGADAALVARAVDVGLVALRALEDYRSFLQSDLLPRSRGDYHLGREGFVRRIRATEGITESPESLRERAEREIQRLRGEVERIAKRIAPHQSAAITVKHLSESHPTGAELLEAYRRRQDSLRRFLRERGIVGFPEEWDVLELVETPRFLRSMVVAACDSAGLFETNERTTYFWVTPVDAAASRDAQEEYLRAHFDESIEVISIHEAYPGHHLQGMHARQSPSKVRRLFWSGTFGEGWAHYTEQMLLDEGYGAGNDRLRLAQLKDALLRAARMALDVGIHVEGMTFEQARDFFQRQVYMERAPAELEAKRVALNPGTVLIHTYGKLEILALREQVRSREGSAFSLASFHDRLLSAGTAPVSLIRREIFGLP